jgi:AAA+ ATPase superfamily predicted ATPase
MTITAGKPVTGDQLIGREKEVRLIGKYLDMGQSVVLIAPRRFGKTSLLLEMLSRKKVAGNFTLFVDFFSTPDLFSLAAEIATQVLSNKKWTWTVHQLKNQLFELLKNIQFRQAVDQYEFIVGFGQQHPDEWELLAESIRFIEKFGQNHGKTMIAGFDEFGDIEKLDGDRIVKLFRSELQRQQKSVYLFAGSYESVMNKIFADKSSPFLRFARVIKLGNIAGEDFIPYIETSLQEGAIDAPETLAREIFDFTGGHPYYTQLLAQQTLVYQRTLKPDHRRMSNLLEETLFVEKDYLERLWESISGNRQQKVVVLTLAEEKGSPYSRLDKNKINISRTLKQLADAGHITHSTPHHSLVDPLFRYWIRKTILKIDDLLTHHS